MPLARIITGNADETFAVSEYLRSEGYTVETVSPADFRITPAELEIDFSRCKRAEAMDRARALVGSRRTEAEPPQETPSALEPVSGGKAKIPIAYDIVGRPVAFADEEQTPSRQEPGGRTALAALFSCVTAPVRDFRRRRAEKRALRLEAQLARSRQERMARERAQQELDRRRAEADLADRRRREQIAADQLAEQERARAALLREAVISAARETARQQEAEAVTAQKLARQGQSEPALVENPVRRQPPARRQEPAQPFVARRRTSTAILRRVGMTALGASLLALLGFVAYANRRPASPLSPAALIMNESIKQEVPFGPVTLTPPAAASSPSLIASGRTRPAAHSTQGWPHGSRQRASSQADADDVAVRHFQSRFSKPQSTASTAALKRNSDTD